INLQRPLPLLLEIIPVVYCTRIGNMPVCMCITAPKSAGSIQRGQPSLPGPVLCYPNGYLLKAAICFFYKTMLRVNFEPSPMVGLLGSFVVHRLTRAISEEVPQFFFQCGIIGSAGNVFGKFRRSHYKGFAFP